MKELRKTITITLLLVAGIIMPAWAEMATMNDALNVANNWINLIIQKKGSWGDANSAFVEDVHEFKRGPRLLGYFCRVQPKGYIVVSLRKELAPVKAYSATCDLVPECDEGLTDVIKLGMERVLNTIEKQLGPIELVRTSDLQNILEISHRDSWDELEVDPLSFQQKLDSGVIAMDYQEGDVLLSSSWHQGDPYNRDCPVPPFGDDCTATHCAVGCVATAAGQIMRYWAWPPYGVSSFSDRYDWPNMPDRATALSTPAQINAVAELCHEIGIAVSMNYCGGSECASGASHTDMRNAYEAYYRYSGYCGILERKDYDTAVEWFNLMKAQLNVNRPVQYGVEGHSLVADGWQEVDPGPIRYYHMNYGWNGGNTGDACWTGIPNSNTWYTLDELPCSDPDAQVMIANIVPEKALFGSLSGTYSRDASFPYLYFDCDTTGNSATFEAGQNLQFLPNITVTCTSTTGSYIRILGTTSNNTLLFTRGDESQGVRIQNGGIRLYQHGSLSFH